MLKTKFHWVFVSILVMALLTVTYLLYHAKEDIKELEMQRKISLHRELIEISNALQHLAQTMNMYSMDDRLFDTLLQRELQEFKRNSTNAEMILAGFSSVHGDQLGSKLPVISYRIVKKINEFFSQDRVDEGSLVAIVDTINKYQEELSDLVWKNDTNALITSSVEDHMVEILEALDTELAAILY